MRPSFPLSAVFALLFPLLSWALLCAGILTGLKAGIPKEVCMHAIDGICTKKTIHKIFRKPVQGLLYFYTTVILMTGTAACEKNV
jgi:hypothetical protein